MNKTVIKGRGITIGVAEGEAMVTDESFGFASSLEPSSGLILDKSHEWLGQNAKGKVLVFPYGKGSTSGGVFILEAVRQGNAPAAVINLETDPIVASGFIIASILYGKEIPVIDRPKKNPFKLIKAGDKVKVDANKGTIEIFH